MGTGAHAAINRNPPARAFAAIPSADILEAESLLGATTADAHVPQPQPRINSKLHTTKARAPVLSQPSARKTSDYNMLATSSVGIIGGGLAGLSCALRLQSLGLDCVVYDTGVKSYTSFELRLGKSVYSLFLARTKQGQWACSAVVSPPY